MCLIFIGYQQHRHFPLIVAANRDEFYARPTEPIHQWQSISGIVAGRDIEKGGTWLGISLDGRFAAVTNYRSGQSVETKRSRGELVLRLLSSDSPDIFTDSELTDTSDSYNDFNCLYYYRHQLYYLSNKNNCLKRKLDPGVYGLSNALLDTPWPKLTNGKAEFTTAIANPSDEDSFWNLLANEQPAADEELPNTGVSPAWEKLLSSRFIRSKDYGTRSSSLLFWSSEQRVKFKERRYDSGGYIGQKDITVQLSNSQVV